MASELLWKRGRVLGRGGFGVVSLASTSNAQLDGVTLPSLIAVKSCMHTASQSWHHPLQLTARVCIRRKPCRSSTELQFRGTERYRVPESVLNSEYGPQVDIWAVGYTVYKLLIGTPLWESDSGSEEDAEDNVLYQIGFEEPKFQNPKLSNEAQDFLKSRHCKDKEEAKWLHVCSTQTERKLTIQETAAAEESIQARPQVRDSIETLMQCAY
ncbi:hypothetical protein RND71_005877 [Anisodus tanguticus]|uniref:Protein kinase domain-containing protein n=1 Tax=Anisodus tanguticus TaxID=243964 RepID=A0AAE1SSW8_9SOLA|nr:hypothetical protein RND71_005877 [Anisodus tanguticus]